MLLTLSINPRTTSLKNIPDHQSRAVDARLDAFARQSENVSDLVDRQFLDIAQQDHLAVMIGQDWMARERSMRMSSGARCASRISTHRQPEYPPFPPIGAAGGGRRGGRPQTATPRTTSPRAAFRPAGTAATAFPEPRHRYRPRGSCARHSGGCRVGPLRSARPAHRRLRRARPRSARGRNALLRPTRSGEGSSWPTMAHIGQKSEEPVRIATAPVPAIR